MVFFIIFGDQSFRCPMALPRVVVIVVVVAVVLVVVVVVALVA